MHIPPKAPERLHLLVDKAVGAKLRRVANATGRSMSDVVTRLIEAVEEPAGATRPPTAALPNAKERN